MSTKLETLENSTVKLTIEVDAARFEQGMSYAYNKNKGHINIPGFRKGKAPRVIIEKQYGAEVFYEDAVNYCIPDAYEAAVDEHNLDVVARPEIDVEQVGKGQNLIFTATVAVKPEVTLGTYKGIETEKVNVEVTEEEIQNELTKMQEKNARLIEITDRPIQEGDIVTIDFEGFTEGVAFEGGKGSDYELTIGSHTFIDTFEDQLIGKSVGDDVEVNVTFPAEYHSEALAGKPAMFQVEIKDMKVKELPALDDEFAKDVSEFETLDEYKANIKDKLLKQKEHAAKHEKEHKVLEKVVENTSMDVPEAMIENQVDQMVQNYSMRMKSQGLQLEQYLQYLGQTLEQFKEGFKEEAAFNVKVRLALEAIAKAENFEVTDADFEAEIEKMAASYNMEVEKLKEAVREGEKEAILEDIKIQKALDFVVENSVEM